MWSTSSREPAPVPRLTGDVPVEAGTKIEKEAGEVRLEGQARRQLHQDGAELLAEGSGLAEKAGERLRYLGQPPGMGDLLRHLHREPEVSRARSPPIARRCWDDAGGRRSC